MSDIIYTEAQNKYQCLHLVNNKKLRVRMTLAELYEKIDGLSDFVRVGSSYIINLYYAESLTAKTMKLDTGEIIWLPRGSYTTLKEQYFKFYLSEKEELK